MGCGVWGVGCGVWGVGCGVWVWGVRIMNYEVGSGEFFAVNSEQ
ncbi:hypothetical protein [Microcystis aeruginosa]|nr:hypothetical protein [Microcystis aeruginosa]